MKRGFLCLFLLGLALSSCERTVDTPLDVGLSQPYLHTLSISPVSFNTDTILVNGQTNPDDIINLSLRCSIDVDVPAMGQAATVTFTMSGPGGSHVYSTGTLRDDGVSPDAVAGDRTFTGNVSFSIRRVEVGLFELSVVGTTSDIIPSNTVKKTVPVFRSSRAPFLYDLNAPDTVTLPPANQVLLILMSVAASDSDGPEDVREVYFRNLDSPSDTTKKFFLYDDGDVTGLSGDSLAGDGTYSIIVQLPSGTPPATYRFSFEATDRLDLKSTPIVHPLTVRSP